MHDEHFDANRRNRNERAAIHAASSMYALDAYRADPDRLSSIVRFDRPRLGDVCRSPTGEVVTALLKRGLALRALVEHDGLERRMFPHMVHEDGRHKLPPEQRAMVYTLIAEKPA